MSKVSSLGELSRAFGAGYFAYAKALMPEIRDYVLTTNTTAEDDLFRIREKSEDSKETLPCIVISRKPGLASHLGSQVSRKFHGSVENLGGFQYRPVTLDYSCRYYCTSWLFAEYIAECLFLNDSPSRELHYTLDWIKQANDDLVDLKLTYTAEEAVTAFIPTQSEKGEKGHIYVVEQTSQVRGILYSQVGPPEGRIQTAISDIRQMGKPPNETNPTNQTLGKVIVSS